MRWDADIPRLVSNAVALLGAEEAAQADRGRHGEARRTRDDPPQMIFMLRKRPFTEARDGRDHDDWTGASR